MQIEILRKQIDSYLKEYISFIGIDSFPAYVLQFREVSLSRADSQGYEVPACTSYKVETDKHTLSIATNLELSKHVAFHEFTHILDSDQYVHGDKVRYAGLSGYTEYHASQVELVQLLGAECISDITPFSMNTILSTLSGQKTVSQYILEKHQHAIELFSRSDFPANIDAWKSAVGVLYNYWGLRSICEMYATDFVEVINNGAFMKYISTLNFCRMNNLMHGWLDAVKIDSSIPLYINAVFSVIQDYKLS